MNFSLHRRNHSMITNSMFFLETRCLSGSVTPGLGIHTPRVRNGWVRALPQDPSPEVDSVQAPPLRKPAICDSPQLGIKGLYLVVSVWLKASLQPLSFIFKESGMFGQKVPSQAHYPGSWLSPDSSSEKAHRTVSPPQRCSRPLSRGI